MQAPSDSATPGEPDVATRIHRWIAVAVALVMSGDVALLLYDRQWQSAFLVFMIMALILAPTLLRDRLPVRIPAEFQVLALVFSFATLFLGEVREYYERIWWWDIALHTMSGLQLGVLGFLLVYVLNEHKRVEMHLRPRFVAFFAFLFAVAVGAIWEIFEFAMDEIFGADMQKAMFDDASGLTDTMWDLIVDTLSALAISLMGWWYMHHRARSFIDRWILKFIDRNPGLFRTWTT
jgi:uncharacterized membrane protein YjdF